jgi:hypothetical protein
MFKSCLCFSTPKLYLWLDAGLLSTTSCIECAVSELDGDCAFEYTDVGLNMSSQPRARLSLRVRLPSFLSGSITLSPKKSSITMFLSLDGRMESQPRHAHETARVRRTGGPKSPYSSKRALGHDNASEMQLLLLHILHS